MDNQPAAGSYIDITRRHTFGIPTKTFGWQEYASVGELQELLRGLHSRGVDFMPIGQGSNLLFLHDYHGVLLHSAIVGIELIEQAGDSVLVRAGSGVVWDDFVAYCVTSGWGGVENLSYIPGEVGASAVQNIGAYGVEACDAIYSVEAVDVTTGHVRNFLSEECAYGYRDSIFKQALRGRYIITYVTYKLSLSPVFRLEYGNLRQEAGANPTLQSIRDAVIAIRRRKLPETSEMGSAGSFFVNPVIPRRQYDELLGRYPDMPHYPVDETAVKVPAGWLIDKLGWSGKSRGGAMVYPRQCLVIVNTGSATADDVVGLAAEIIRSVWDTYQIEIKPEVNYIG